MVSIPLTIFESIILTWNAAITRIIFCGDFFQTCEGPVLVHCIWKDCQMCDWIEKFLKNYSMSLGNWCWGERLGEELAVLHNVMITFNIVIKPKALDKQTNKMMTSALHDMKSHFIKFIVLHLGIPAIGCALDTLALI